MKKNFLKKALLLTLCTISTSTFAQSTANTNAEVFEPSKNKENGFVLIGKIDYGVMVGKNYHGSISSAPINAGIPLGKAGKQVLLIGLNIKNEDYDLDDFDSLNHDTVGFHNSKIAGRAGMFLNQNSKTREYTMVACEIGSQSESTSLRGFNLDSKNGLSVGLSIETLVRHAKAIQKSEEGGKASNALEGSYFFSFHSSLNTKDETTGEIELLHSGYPVRVGSNSALGYYTNYRSKEYVNANNSFNSVEAGVNFSYRQNLILVGVGVKYIDAALSQLGYQKTSCFPTFTFKMDISRLNGEMN